MADFTALKTAIQNAIKQNGNEEITGNLLQDVLLAIVTTLGEGNINNLINSLDAEVTARQQAVSAEAQARQLADSTLQGGINTVSAAITAINNAIGNGCVYAGIATPSSTPASGRVFYLALTAGTYTNFGNLVVTQGINILKNNGSTWSLDSFLGIDDAPTPSSNKLVKSGGVFNDIMTNGSAFDLSAYNGGATYADLNAALTALNALPAAYKKGGMSLKFVLSSDNNYIQARLMANEFTTDVTQWQGVDSQATAGSKNLIESGGVKEDFFTINGNLTKIQGDSLVVSKSVESGQQVKGWSENHEFYKGITYVVENTEYSYTSLIFYDEGDNELYRTNLSPNTPIEVTLSDVAVKVGGYSTNESLNIVFKTKTSYKDIIEKNVSDIEVNKTQIENLDTITKNNIIDKITISKNAGSGQQVKGWNMEHVFLKNVPYTITTIGTFYSSIIFYDENNTEVYRTNLSPNNIISVTLDAVCTRVAGYSTNEAINIVIESENIITKHTNQLTSVVGDSISFLKEVESGQIGGWNISHNFAKDIKYYVSSGVGFYTSMVFYDKENAEVYRTNISPNNLVSLTLNKDCVRVAGYSTNTKVDFTIYAENRIDNLENPKTILQLNPRSLYDGLVNDIGISKADGKNRYKFFTLLHFSDIHENKENVNRLMEFYNRYSANIDDVICSGDIVGDVFSNPNILSSFPNILEVIGNHDSWIRSYDADLADYQEPNENIWVVKQKNVYDKFIKDYVSSWSVTQPSDAGSLGKCYYYKDYSNANTSLRVIVLDCMHFGKGADISGGSSVQNAWLQSTLSDARANQIPVVIVCHYWPTNTYSPSTGLIQCSYTTTDGIASSAISQLAVESVQDFIDEGGEFVCWVCGHSHTDAIGLADGYPDQLFISVDCATNASSFGNSLRTANTKLQDSFNIISFDTHDKIVKVVKVGCDVTRQLTQKRRLVYRYAQFTDIYDTVHNKELVLSD